MIDASVRKANIRWNISQNPVDILIHRVEKVRSGGGFEEKESTVGPFTVRIFMQKSQIPQTVSTLAGTKQTDTKYSLLADDLADIRADSQTTDAFEANGQKFEVIGVEPQIVQGEVVGFQVDLERTG